LGDSSGDETGRSMILNSYHAASPGITDFQ
jgi:hypothetical protein